MGEINKRFERRYDEGYTTIYNWYIDGKKTIDPQIIEDTLNEQDAKIKELKQELGQRPANRRWTVGELINELEKIPKDTIVELSVNYDHCDHMQDLSGVYYYESGRWVVLQGGKND